MGSPGLWIQFCQKRPKEDTFWGRWCRAEACCRQDRLTGKQTGRLIESIQKQEISFKEGYRVISKRQGPWGRRNIAKQTAWGISLRKKQPKSLPTWPNDQSGNSCLEDKDFTLRLNELGGSRWDGRPGVAGEWSHANKESASGKQKMNGADRKQKMTSLFFNYVIHYIFGPEHNNTASSHIYVLVWNNSVCDCIGSVQYHISQIFGTLWLWKRILFKYREPESGTLQTESQRCLVDVKDWQMKTCGQGLILSLSGRSFGNRVLSSLLFAPDWKVVFFSPSISFLCTPDCETS